MKKKYLLLTLAPAFGFLIPFVISSLGERQETSALSEAIEPVVRPVEAVAALGQLSPLGEVRRLAAPISGFGGTPRIARLLINEGESVTKGQTLALFDNRPQIIADLAVIKARVKTLGIKIKMHKRHSDNFKKLFYHLLIQSAINLFLTTNKLLQIHY